MSTTILKKKADAIFSTYIRLKYADENLDVQCFTCDKVMPYKKIQNFILDFLLIQQHLFYNKLIYYFFLIQLYEVTNI